MKQRSRWNIPYLPNLPLIAALTAFALFILVAMSQAADGVGHHGHAACVASCLKQLRPCSAAARGDLRTCRAGCADEHQAVVANCSEDPELTPTADCMAAVAAWRACVAPCRDQFRTDSRTCLKTARTCTHACLAPPPTAAS